MTREDVCHYSTMSVNISGKMEGDNSREQLVRAVLDAVDGTFRGADEKVTNLNKAEVQLTAEEANAILASFLIFDTDERCVREYGEGYGHEYLTSFGAKVPRSSMNQLQSSYELAQRFHDACIKGRGLPIDQVLYGLFCAYFKISNVEWIPTDNAAVNVAVGKILVKKVMDVVRGDSTGAKTAVKNLVRAAGAVPDLDVDDAEAIMAYFLMFELNSKCIRTHGEGHGHAYFKMFGAAVPAKQDVLVYEEELAHRFHDSCIKGRGLPIDQDLYGLFCAYFDIRNAEWVPSDSAPVTDFVRSILVKKVVEAVDGSVDNAKTAVDNLVREGVGLTSDQVNVIVASFLMFDTDERCIRTYGEGHGHKYLESFGAKVPSKSMNQLHGTGLAASFRSFIEGRRSLVDPGLFELFCAHFPLVDAPSLSNETADATVDTAEILVQAVVEAVDGAAGNAKTAVENLVRAEARLSAKQVNTIMASFLILREETRCIRQYGEGHGHKYFTEFGAKVPRFSTNQLHNNILAGSFWSVFGNVGSAIDSVLKGLFCGCFGETPEDLLQNLDNALAQQVAFLGQLKDKIKNKELVVMTGIGVSLAIAGNNRNLTWDGLLNEIRAMLASRPNPVTIPDHKWRADDPEVNARELDAVVKDQLPHLDYRQYVSVIMRKVNFPDQAPLADAIGSLGLPIATTNYDLILDHCLKRFEKSLSDVHVRFSPAHHREFVYHVHGVWFDSDSVVLSDLDYNRTQDEFEYAMDQLLFSPVGLGNHRSLLFIGTKRGMVDAHFSALYTDPRFSQLRHFALLRRSSLEELWNTNPEFVRAVRANKLVPVIYEDLLACLQSLLTADEPNDD